MTNDSQMKLKRLVEAAMGKRTVQETYDEMQIFFNANPELKLHISKQYLQSIIDGNAPNNPSMKSAFILHITLKIPIVELYSAYGYFPNIQDEIRLSRNIVNSMYENLDDQNKILEGLKKE